MIHLRLDGILDELLPIDLAVHLEVRDCLSSFGWKRHIFSP